jgi:RNA polymerase sigma-70 factor, ECF subfamily
MDEAELKFTGDRSIDLRAFETLYNKYYTLLCIIADRIIGDKEISKEIVSNVFLKIWNERENIYIRGAVKPYLCQAVKNSAINYINSKQYRNSRLNNPIDLAFEQHFCESNFQVSAILEEEMLTFIEREVNSLPESCKRIFLLSRESDLNYKQIAEKLGISVNTVKTQMKIALFKLRENVKKYMDTD